MKGGVFITTHFCGNVNGWWWQIITPKMVTDDTVQTERFRLYTNEWGWVRNNSRCKWFWPIWRYKYGTHEDRGKLPKFMPDKSKTLTTSQIRNVYIAGLKQTQNNITFLPLWPCWVVIMVQTGFDILGWLSWKWVPWCINQFKYFRLTLKKPIGQTHEPWILVICPQGSKPHLPVQTWLMGCCKIINTSLSGTRFWHLVVTLKGTSWSNDDDDDDDTLYAYRNKIIGLLNYNFTVLSSDN